MKTLYKFCEEYYSLCTLDKMAMYSHTRIITDYKRVEKGIATLEEVDALFDTLYMEFIVDLTKWCSEHYPKLPHKSAEIAELAFKYREYSGSCRPINFITLEKLQCE